MICFGDYLKDHLEARDICQSEFATRIGVSQKHMNEILNGKVGITMEMAGNIERLIGIESSLIIGIENIRKFEEKLIKNLKTKENIKSKINKEVLLIIDLKKVKY